MSALAVNYPIQTRNSRTELVYRIPGLPELATANVEGLPQIRPGQNIPLSNEEWFDWYEAVIDHRLQTHRETEERSTRLAQARKREIDRVKADERYWFYTYPAIYESRSDEPESVELESEDEAAFSGAVAGYLPYILYPFQDYWITWHGRALRTRGPKGDTVTIKSRDMGMSNTAMGAMTWRWMTRRIYQGRVLSRVQELVDASGDTDALMWKSDLMLRSTPRWMLDCFAPGFSWEAHRRELTLENPHNANMLKGESTNATAGRGKRCAGMLLDEFTFMRGFKQIWTATRPACYHRDAVGSVSTSQGMAAFQLVQSDGPAIIQLDARTGMHPRQDAAWHEHERARDPAGYAQEVGMDWFADAGDFVYPDAHKKQVGDFPYLPFAGPVFAAIDDGVHWAIWFIQYVRATGRFRAIDCYRNRGQRVDFYGSLLRGQYHGEFSYGDDEHAIIELTRQVPIAHFVGDHHGANVEQVAGMSVIEHLAHAWNIHLIVNFERQHHKDRQHDLAELLPLMDFNDTPRVRIGLQSLQMYQYRPTPPGKEVAKEAREPLHNDDSHAATALEYFANNFEAFKYSYSGMQIVYEGEANR